jgi:hypothetical protein
MSEQVEVAFQRQGLPRIVKAAMHTLVKTITVMWRLDHVADRTGKPARSFPDGKQVKRD